MTTSISSDSVISEEMLERFGSRAATYDRENRFFQEDWDELKAAGYLKAAVPKEFGGLGLSLAEVCKEQARIAYRAPATALATNMHIYWTGMAADMRRMGDASLEWLLREAADGEIFAAGHGERGVDLPLFLSTTSAKRVDGGYEYRGHKIFGSLSPVWTRLGLHGMDTEAAGGAQIVHAFMPRETKGYRIEKTWDTSGMRATQSDDTILEGAMVPDKYIARVLPAGGADLFVLGVFAWVEPTFASIYLGLAKRAIDLSVQSAQKRTSLALTRPMSYHPQVQFCLSEMTIAYNQALAYVEKIAADWSNGVDYGAAWPSHLVSVKHCATQAASKIIDLAMTVSGGSGLFKTNELERLTRDVRAGLLHPANELLVPEIVGKTALGIELGEQPRWG